MSALQLNATVLPVRSFFQRLFGVWPRLRQWRGDDQEPIVQLAPSGVVVNGSGVPGHTLRAEVIRVPGGLPVGTRDFTIPANGTVDIRFDGIPGGNYRVVVTDQVTGGVWETDVTVASPPV